MRSGTLSLTAVGPLGRWRQCQCSGKGGWAGPEPWEAGNPGSTAPYWPASRGPEGGQSKRRGGAEPMRWERRAVGPKCLCGGHGLPPATGAAAMRLQLAAQPSVVLHLPWLSSCGRCRAQNGVGMGSLHRGRRSTGRGGSWLGGVGNLCGTASMGAQQWQGCRQAQGGRAQPAAVYCADVAGVPEPCAETMRNPC